MINSTCVGDTMVLKPVGNSATATAPTDRRDPHVKFMTFQVLLDFKDLWRRSVSHLPQTMTITTTVELPQTISSVLCNSTGSPVAVSVSTWVGPDNITLLKPEVFKAILEIMGQ